MLSGIISLKQKTVPVETYDLSICLINAIQMHLTEKGARKY
jgi:hypothetical protein